MCDEKTCPGDPDAPDKWTCKACYGVTYRDPGEMKENFILKKRSEQIREVCKRLYRAVTDLESIYGCKTDHKAICSGLIFGTDEEAAATLSILLDGKYNK